MTSTPKAPQLGLFSVSPTVNAAPWAEAQTTLAAALPTTLSLGTSSWSFPGWEGLVYAQAHRSAFLSRQGLAAYASNPLLSTVSIDRGFYSPVPEQDFTHYQSQVPQGFRFVVKAWRQLTAPVINGKRNSSFLDAPLACQSIVVPAKRGLKDTLDCILFQFSPMHLGQVGGVRGFCEQLAEFLSKLPDTIDYAVEVRNPELLGTALQEALSRPNRFYTINLLPAMPGLDQQFRSMRLGHQSRYLVRWLLAKGHSYQGALQDFAPFDRLVAPSDPIIERMVQFIRWAESKDRHFSLQVNNKAEGCAPLTLQRVARMLANNS